jgi:hypothetical protein
MDQATHGSLIDPTASRTQEQGFTGSGLMEQRASNDQPTVKGTLRRLAVGNHPLLATLAQNAQHPSLAIEISDIEAGQLTHPNACCVQHLQDGHITQAQRVFVGVLDRGSDQGLGFIGTQNRGQGLGRLG